MWNVVQIVKKLEADSVLTDWLACLAILDNLLILSWAEDTAEEGGEDVLTYCTTGSDQTGFI